MHKKCSASREIALKLDSVTVLNWQLERMAALRLAKSENPNAMLVVPADTGPDSLT